MLYARDLFDRMEPVLISLALLVTLLRPAWLGAIAVAVSTWFRRGFARIGRRLASRPRLLAVIPVLSVALVGVAAAALVVVFHGVPAPRVSDEFAYLLQADTFAHGRGAMPTPPSPEHFETFFVLVEPTYAAKYPPGQGIVLGIAQAMFGHPAVGLWLLTGAMAGALFWALGGFVAWPWALAGTALGLCRFGFLTYWSNSYWGGNLAAIGGALVWGSVARLVAPSLGSDGDDDPEPPVWRLGIVLGLGVSILANSRPFEGMIVALPAALMLALWAIRCWRRGHLGRALRCAAATSAVLLVAASAMATYNRAVTGDPWRLPYAEWEAQYATVPNLSGQPLTTPSRSRPVEIERFYHALEAQYDPHRRWIGVAAAGERLADTLRFYLGPALLMVMLAGMVMRVGIARPGRGPSIVVPMLTLLALLAVQQVVRPWWPHYAAPAAVLFLLPVVVGARRLWMWDVGPGSRWQGRWRGRWQGMGRSLVAAALAINVTQLLPQWIERQRESQSWGHDRRDLARSLEQRPGKDLIFVRYGGAHHPAREWVFNRADIPNSAVLWARDLGADANQRLIASLGARELWLLEIDRVPREPPRLLPYPASSNEQQSYRVDSEYDAQSERPRKANRK